MNKLKQQYFEFDYIRVIGTLLVVIGHSAYTNMVTSHGGIAVAEDYCRTQVVLLLFVRLIYSFHMPLFFFLSGTLFELGTRNGKWSTLKSVASGKIRRLLKPLLLVGVLYAIPIKILSGYYNNSECLLFDSFVGQMILFDNNYLWFLLALFWCFLLSYTLHRFFSNNQIYVIAIIIVFIGINLKTNAFCIKSACYDFIWFELGRWFLDLKEELDLCISNRTTLMIILFSAIVYVIYLKFFKDNPYFYRFLPVFGITTVYCMVMSNLGTHLEKTRLFQIVRDKSMAIYLYSDPWNYIVLATIKKLNLAELYKHDVFCFGIFTLRVLFTLIIALFVQYIIDSSRVSKVKLPIK